MSRTATFGIAGGYGATGRAVAAELWKSCDGTILVGGRDTARTKSMAATFEKVAFMAELRNAGIRQTETLEQSAP
jgi:hypothetical protein